VKSALVRVALAALCVLALITWWWRKHMAKKPAEVVRDIKAKVASVKSTRAKPVAPSAPTEEAQVCEAPVVASESTEHCPQGAPWCCFVCGNVATGPVCTVDGAKGNA
jgi:hypothetical protein